MPGRGGARVRVYISRGSKTSTVKFAYNEDIIEIVRGYIGRRWDSDNRVWVIYNHDVPKFEEAVKKLGHSVHYVTGAESKWERRRYNPFDDENEDFNDWYRYEWQQEQEQRQQSQSEYRSWDWQRQHQQTPPRTGRPTTTAEQEREWAVALFRKVGKKRARAVYRALAKVLHSDIGEDGDAALIQQLNDAYEPWKKME